MKADITTTDDPHHFTVDAKRWLRPEMTVLEVDPGDGAWTVRIAPLVRTLIVVSPAEEILQRTRERCEALGIRNVQYVLASGSDLAPLPDRCIDLFFSRDGLAQSALDDALGGAAEIVRVLKPGAICVSCHDLGDQHDSADSGESGNRSRDRADTLGRPCDVSSVMLNRIYEHVGLRVFAVQQDGSCCTVLATRTADSIATAR
jgi:SAM-dependent methyltransferase